jgi:elongation factor P
MATTADLFVGAVLRFEGNLCEVLESTHRTPGNLRAFYQVKMRNLRTGKSFEQRFRSGEELEFISLETKKLQYLYHDGSDYIFMDSSTYEQFPVDGVILGDKANFLKEGDLVSIDFNGHDIVRVDIPMFVELKVVETEPGIRGDTATGGTKPAVLESGAKVQVPFFINEGDVVKVDTRTAQYLERVKN